MKKVSFDMIDNYISETLLNKNQTTVPEKSIIDTDLVRKILFENLTDKQKLYILLYYKQKLTMEEIAEKCKVAKSTVSRTVSRGRNNIAKGLKSQMVKYLLCSKENDNDEN